ncbi:hypothetical protein CR513_05385, partial [Mucuna pruriens]
MSMMGELNLFLRLQIKQVDDGIHIHQTNYVKELLKKFKLNDCKSMFTPMHPTFILSLDEFDKKVHQTTYKGITNLSLWFNKFSKYKLKGYCGKRQGIITLSTTKAKYISIVLNFSRSSINLKTTTYLRVTSIYFKGIFNIKFINTNEQLVDIFTNPFPKDKLIHTRKLLGLDLIDDLKVFGILAFFNNEQVVRPKLIREFWTNCFIEETFIVGKVLRVDVRVDIASIATTTWCERTRKVYRFGWERDYGGLLVVEDALLRPNAKGPFSLNKISDKARIFQQMLNKDISHKTSSKGHLFDIHLFALFHMMIR